jgi:hypothetical protein
MPDLLFRGKCPFGDCGRVILFHEEAEVGHPGVCPDCLRRYRITERANGMMTLRADPR